MNLLKAKHALDATLAKSEFGTSVGGFVYGTYAFKTVIQPEK